MTGDEHQHELVTVAEAASILDMSTSGVFKLLTRGVLERRADGRGRKVGVVRRSDVEQLAAHRAQVAAEREHRQPDEPRSLRPEPVNGHRWLTPPEAAPIIGITAQAIRRRCIRGTIPHLRQGSRWFIREDHARLAGHVRVTDGPEAVAIALDGLR